MCSAEAGNRKHLDCIRGTDITAPRLGESVRCAIVAVAHAPVCGFAEQPPDVVPGATYAARAAWRRARLWNRRRVAANVAGASQSWKMV
jgi:hypothetical protein